MAKKLDGTNLLPSPDGLFGIGSSSTSGSGAAVDSTSKRKGSSTRANPRTRNFRSYTANPGGNGGYTDGGKGSFQQSQWHGGSNGKGKDSQMKGKNKNGKGQSKGKKGGKEATK